MCMYVCVYMYVSIYLSIYISIYMYICILTHGTSTFQCHTTSQITIQIILSNLPCVDLHTETLAGKDRSLLHNISGEFSRLPLNHILCHGAHEKAKNLADQASGSGRSSEFFAGWPKILDGHPSHFWVSSFVCGGFSDSSSASGIVVTPNSHSKIPVFSDPTLGKS